MQIYRLSPIGYRLSHTVTHEDKPAWRVIHYLAREHVASKDKILTNIPGVTSATLGSLCRRGILVEESGVIV